MASTAPEAIDGLIAALGESDELDGKIIDGPTVAASSMKEAVVVGFEDEDTPVVVEANASIEGAVVTSTREQYTITCAASALRGNGDIAQARTRVYELFADVGNVVAADKTLGGAVMSAHIGSHTLRQVQNRRGALATVVFGVAVDAFTRR